MFAAIGSRSRDVAESHCGVSPCQMPRKVQREVVGNAPVFIRCHADRRYAQAKEAGIVAGQLRLDGRELKEIGLNDFTRLLVRTRRIYCDQLATGDQAAKQSNLMSTANRP